MLIFIYIKDPNPIQIGQKSKDDQSKFKLYGSVPKNTGIRWLDEFSMIHFPSWEYTSYVSLWQLSRQYFLLSWMISMCINNA